MALRDIIDYISFRPWLRNTVVATVLGGAILGGAQCSGCSSKGNVYTRGHLEAKCVDIANVEYCNLVQTNNPNRVYFLKGLDDDSTEVNFQELPARKVSFRKMGNQGYIVGPQGEELVPETKFKVGYVDLGGAGRLNGVLLPQGDGLETIFCDPSEGKAQSFTSRIVNIPCYDQRDMQIEADISSRSPRMIRIIDTREVEPTDINKQLGVDVPDAGYAQQPVINTLQNKRAFAIAGSLAAGENCINDKECKDGLYCRDTGTPDYGICTVKQPSVDGGQAITPVNTEAVDGGSSDAGSVDAGLPDCPE